MLLLAVAGASFIQALNSSARCGIIIIVFSKRVSIIFFLSLSLQSLIHTYYKLEFFFSLNFSVKFTSREGLKLIYHCFLRDI